VARDLKEMSLIAQARGIHAYRQVQTESRSPHELVVKLYDGALANLAQAGAAAARGDLRQRGASITKTLAIIGTLQENLNLDDGGAIAEELDRLYLYATSRLVDVTARHDTGAIEEVQKLLTGLREAWHQVASQPSQMSA
jgi:flagellar protein FliS